MYKFLKGDRLFVKGSREDDDPDNVADPNEQELIHDRSVERHNYDSKNHMASASQESREVFRTAQNRNGLKTIHTQRVVKKTTSVNRGEQKKLPTYPMIDGNKLKEKLMRWAQKSTRGYPNVNVTDFTKSWRDGLAFSAIIHRNRPDLIDFHKCRESSAKENLYNAFNVLEKLGITPTLNPDDLAKGVTSEDDMVKYLSAVYDMFPNPPEHNPLWDAEKIRRIDEYKDLASCLLVWLRESIPKLKERNFPNTLNEVIALKEENRLFKTEQIPPKLHDKQRLASSYEDVLNMARGLPGKHVKIEEEYSISNIEHLWNKMITAHQERDHAIHEEISRLEKLERIAEGLIKQIDICDNNLDMLKKRIITEEQRVHKQDPLEHNSEIDNIQRDINIEEDRIKNMYVTLNLLSDNKYHKVGQLSNQVDYLNKKLNGLKMTFENNVVQVLNARRAEALRKPKTEEELIKENSDFKFLHDCIQWVIEKKQHLEGLNFGEDIHSIQRRLEQFTEESKNIKDFQSKIEQCQSRKRNIKPEELPIYTNMLNRLFSRYDDLVSFCNKRINDLKSVFEFVKLADKQLDWISNKEEIEISRDWSLKNLNLEEISKYHYSLVKEMENREREFASVQDKGESLIRNRHPCTKFIEGLMAKMQYNWSWLLQLINCLEEQLRYTEDFYNYMDSVNESKKYINMIEDKLNNQFSRQHFLIDEGDKMSQDMMVLKDDIAKLSDTVSELEEKCSSIVNLKQRKAPLPRPIKVKSLCMIKNEQSTITKNEMVTLYDNSQRLKWKIRTNNNVELSIPSVCFVIPPPDPDILDAFAELRDKLKSLIDLWAQRHRELRQNMVLASMKIVKDWDYPTYCATDPAKLARILSSFDDDISKLAKEGPPDDPKIRHLEDEMKDIKKKFADFEARKRREDQEKMNQAINQKFIEAVSDILEKLQEKERILIQRAQNQIPRDRQTLESLIAEHNEFEHDLSKYLSKIESFKSEFVKISNKSHAAQSKYEAIIETWDRLCTLSKHYFERLKALEVVLVDIDQATSTLNTAQSKLVQHDEISADELDLKRMNDELIEINSSTQSNSNSFEQLLSNVTKVRRLVERTRPKQSTHSDLNRLEDDVKTLYKKWKSAAAEVSERIKSLESCRDLLKKYKTRLDNEKSWMNQTNAKVKTMFSRSDLEFVTKIYENIVERKPSIEETIFEGNRFITVAKTLTQKIKAYRDSLDDHAELSAKRPRKFGGIEIVEHELESLNNEYKTLLDKVLSYLNQLQDDETRLKEFNAIAGKLSDWLNLKENLIHSLGPIGSESYIVNNQLKQINAIKDEFSSQEHLLNKMDKLGNSILERMDRTNPSSKEIQNKMIDIHKNWQRLLAILDEREKNLISVKEAAADFQNKLNKLQTNLNGMSDEFDRIISSGLDNDDQLLKITNLEENLEAQRPLLAECSNSCSNLCNLLTAESSKNETKEKFKNVENKYNDLSKKIGNKKVELQSTLKEDREFFMSCDQLQEWLRNMLNTLSKDIRISAILETVTKQIHDFEPIYRQVMDKEHEVHMVLNKGNSILNKSSYRNDSSNWRHTLDNVKRQWELVRKEAIEKNTKLHKCLDICRKFNNSYNDLYPLLKQYEAKLDSLHDISLQRPELERQFRDVQSLKNDISKHHQDFDNLRSLADSLFSVADTDKDYVKNQINQLKELWDNVNNEAFKRHQLIDSILHKLILYNDNLRDFIHNLQRIEDKVSTHEAYADPKILDRMRNLLDEARGLSNQLEILKNHAIDLINEVKNDHSTIPIKNEVRDAEDRYNALLARLEEKCKQLDIISSNIKSFNLKLSEIQNELNKLEEILNNMEPIARNLNILKTQLEEIKEFRSNLEKVNRKLKDVDEFYKNNFGYDLNYDTHVNKFQLDNLNRQYARIDDNSIQRLNNILAMIDKMKSFSDDLSNLDKNLSDVTKEFDRLKPISRDVDTIRSQQNEFKNFIANNVDPISKQVGEIVRKGNGLIQSAAPGVDTNKIENDVEQMNNKWNGLKDKINERGQKLDVAMLQAGQFQDALDKFEKWLNEIEMMINNQKSPSWDYKILKSQIQEQQNIKRILHDRESNLKTLADMGEDFMKSLDSHDKDQIKSQLKDFTKRFNNINNNCNHRMALLEQILPFAKAFADKTVPLQEWLNVSERKLNMLKQSTSVDQENIKNKLQEHKNLHQDILNHKYEFEDLTEIAQNLMSLLSDDEAQIVVDRFKELTDRYAKLVEDSINFGDMLNESNDILNNFILNFEDLFNWIDQMDARVNKHRISSVTVDKIKDQINDLHEINQEIHVNDKKVYDVIHLGQNFIRTLSGSDSLFIKQKSDQLQFKFNELKRKASEYFENLKEALSIAQNFYKCHDKLNVWFDFAERTLKNLESQNLKQQEAAIHTLEGQINENKSLLEVVNNMGPQFCQYAPGQGTATIEGIVIKDNRRFNSICEQIKRQVDKIVDAKQRNDEVVNGIDELYDWFKDAERQLLEAEGISYDPQKLTILLKETKALYDDINSQKGRVRDILLNVKKLMRNTNNEDMIYIREKSEELKDLANHVSQLCLDRLNLLEQALPLAEHFFEAHNELSHWLDEAENESQMLNSTAINPIQIKRQQDIINNLNRAVSEHKPVVDRLNKTGQSLGNIVQEQDAKQVKRIVDNINQRYNDLKNKLRSQQMILDSALQETSQFTDKLDGLLKILGNTLDQLKNMEPISAYPERIEGQVYDINSILDDLDKRRPTYESISQVARDIINKAGKTDDPAVRDIFNKHNKLNEYWNQCNSLAGNRKNALDEAYRIATNFWKQLADVNKSLKEIEQTLNSEEQPACEPNAIYRQQERLKDIKRDMDLTKQKMNDCEAIGRDLIKICGDSEKYEIKKNIDNMDSVWNNVVNLYNKREASLKDAMERAMKFHEALQNLLEFFDSAEETFGNFHPVASDMEAVKVQIKELNGFKKHVDSRMSDIEKFNRLGNDLLECVSSSQAKSIREPLNEINHRWDDLLKSIASRQAELENALLKLGQFEQSLNDFLEWIKKTERALDEIKPVFTDQNILEVELAKFKVLMNDIYAHQSTVDTLNSAGKMLIENERGSENARSTQTKLNNLNSKWQQLLDKTEQRKREIEELLKEAQSFNQELLDTISWINDIDSELSVSKPVGGLPETAKEQLARFMETYNEIDSNRFKVESLFERGNEYLRRSKDAPNLQHNLKTLKSKWESVLSKANDKKIKLEIALAEAIEFHNSLESFIEWLTDAEKYFSNLHPVSRVLDRITEQIEEHKKFQKNLSDHRETMLDLDKKGTHLKYFSQKQDVILIKNLLVNVQHRWEKVLSKAAERSRNLDYGFRETKEFYDAWQELMAWLDELEKNFDSTQQLSNNSEIIRQMIQKHREFQRQLGSKHSQYDNTLKMGKHLKEKAPKIDVPIIQNMIDELKNKWNSICNKSVDRQRKLEEALLFSGQFKDAIDALIDWLEKAKNLFLSNASVYGDLDTVTALVEEHKIFQEEFKRREKNLQSVYRISEELLKSAQEDDSFNIQAEIDALNQSWKEVGKLSEERSCELEKAIVEAEKLHKAVHMLLEWLSDAEMKLRFSGPLPENEDATRSQIEEHDVFMEEMTVQEKSKESTVGIAQDILDKCHPEAAPVIKHWITIIQARWEEVNSWAKQREQRLQDHLKSLLDIMDLLEKLLAWLIGAEAALLAAETQPLPDDNIELEKLIDEHTKFMEELEKKGVEVDKIVKLFATKKNVIAPVKSKDDRLNKRGFQRASTPIRIQTDFGYDVKHPKVKELLEKWNKVNKLAQDRMKRLQDKLNYNSEVERMKNFDFDDWRRRFLGWMSNKKARAIDFYKKIDTNNDGKVTKSEFVEGFVSSKFTTSRLEMEKVVETFDRNSDGYIDHKEYVDTLRPDRDIPKTESEIIQDEVHKQVDKCTCMDKYKVSQVGECKYRFGESQKLRLVRILRSTVMVRVGGGWISLGEFLQKYDPCRLKGRTNVELREQLSDLSADSKHKSIYNEDGTISSVGPITKIKEKTERSMPMNAHDQHRFNSTSDYSFSDHADSSGAKSRPRSRLTISSNSRPGSRHSSQPPSRAGSDLSVESLDSLSQKVSYKFTTKTTTGTKKFSNSKQGSLSNLRDKLK